MAEQERDGGVSPTISPMISVSDIGNVMQKAKFKLPAVDIVRTQAEFTSTFHLFQYLRLLGEQNGLTERRGTLTRESFIGAAALYQTLFNVKK